MLWKCDRSQKRHVRIINKIMCQNWNIRNTSFNIVMFSSESLQILTKLYALENHATIETQMYWLFAISLQNKVFPKWELS